MNPLFEIIASEMQKSGVLSFARFMELTLYCPVYGYYEREKDNVGRGGDFFTSSSVGSLFGELLAFQFCHWFHALRARDSERESDTLSGPPTIVEAGANNGQLARDILTWLRQWRPDVFGPLQYAVVERSDRCREAQESSLSEFRGKIHWKKDLSDLKRDPRFAAVCGILFSNEMLDAMPVHRLGWDAARRRWFEWGVALEDQTFVWVKIQDPAFDRPVPNLPHGLLAVLPDNFITEICPAAERWWTEAGTLLQRGKLMTVDYGLTVEERFIPERSQGTLRAYSRHHPRGDLLAGLGEQDLTAHVDFTSLQRAGESAGLRTEALESQEKFLTRIAEQTWKRPEAFGRWTPERIRQFQTLIHPQHLGRLFRVLLQSR